MNRSSRTIGVRVKPLPLAQTPLAVQLAICAVEDILESLDGHQALQVLLSNIYDIAQANDVEVRTHIAGWLIDTANKIEGVS
jgi:hypothetical protein